MHYFSEPLERRILLASGFPIALGSGGVNYGRSTATLPGGDLIVAGLFSGTVDFDPATTQRGDTLTSVGDTDAFIARYTREGFLIWAKRLGGDAGEIDFDDDFDDPLDSAINPERTGGEFVNPVGADARNAGEYVTAIALGPASENSIFITGAFRGVASFGDRNSSANILSTNRGYPDIFVLKLSDSGDLIWSKQFGGQFTDIANDIAVGFDGNAYVVGLFTRTADFNPGRHTFFVTALGRADAFTMRLDNDGNLLWVAPMGSDAIGHDELESANGIAVDRVGNAYITGSFAGKADFNPTPGKKNVLYIKSAGETDIFTACLSTRGKLAWIKTQGGEEFDAGRAIVLTGDMSNPDPVTVSYFQETIDGDPGSRIRPFTATPEEPGDDPFATDLLITKLNHSNGNFVWARQIAGNSFETVGGLSTDMSNNIFLSGGFQGAVDFDPSRSRNILTSKILPDEFNDPNEDDGDRDFSYDGFFMSLDFDGNFRFAKQFGGNNDEFVMGISRGRIQEAANEFLLTGRFSGITDLSPTATAIRRTTLGKTAIFVSLFDQDGNLA